jgi:hypothetical protein
MQKYTEIQTLKISKMQKETLAKMKQNKVCISNFIRNAIKEKIQREYSELIKKPEKIKCPF